LLSVEALMILQKISSVVECELLYGE